MRGQLPSGPLSLSSCVGASLMVRLFAPCDSLARLFLGSIKHQLRQHRISSSSPQVRCGSGEEHACRCFACDARPAARWRCFSPRSCCCHQRQAQLTLFILVCLPFVVVLLRTQPWLRRHRHHGGGHSAVFPFVNSAVTSTRSGRTFSGRQPQAETFKFSAARSACGAVLFCRSNCTRSTAGSAEPI